jgi:hypothetical protein
MKTLPRDFEDRFTPVTESGCWLWDRGCTGAGYGAYQVKPSRVVVGAHRFAYEQLREPIPKGFHIDHLCRVPSCVNPDHMEVVTRKVNILRGVSPAAKNSRKEECYEGHLLSGGNLYVVYGQRRCRKCHSERQRRYMLKKRGGLDNAATIQYK